MNLVFGDKANYRLFFHIRLSYLFSPSLFIYNYGRNHLYFRWYVINITLWLVLLLRQYLYIISAACGAYVITLCVINMQKLSCYIYLFQGIIVKALMCYESLKKKTKDARIFPLFYRTSDVVMSHNYLDIITYAFF
jgi:hypothetical protein